MATMSWIAGEPIAAGQARVTATEVKLPRLGQGMESGTIVRWLKAEGDAVKKREPLYELDTDKVTQEVESDVDGVLLKIVVAEGEVEVGSTIAMIGRTAALLTAAPPDGAAEPSPSRQPHARRRHPAARNGNAASPSGNGDAAGSSAGRQRAAASRHRRWRGGSRASAGSTSPHSRARAPTAASSPRTSRTPPSAARPPRPPRSSRLRTARSRWSS